MTEYMNMAGYVSQNNANMTKKYFPHHDRGHEYDRIFLDFGDAWHKKFDGSQKQHLSLPKKLQVNAVISELN
ncbi:hypothetical protein BY996DRAFT_6531903 [Phakopsora pachyrhizi]|nr:hypothetical protein BY996DRAFT_6531903 [Phakopsora pachyrhizi]